MRKIVLISLFLLNLLPMIENGCIKTCIVTATAQIMGTEQYDCEDELGPYQSSFPCGVEPCVTTCEYCDESMPCNQYEGHYFVVHSDEDSEEKPEEEEDTPETEEDDEDEDGGGSGGGGGKNHL